MVKAHSGHNLQRKFKPWRKGKSANAKKGTLKSQLRGQERLLAKATETDRQDAIRLRIQELKGLIAEKNQRELVKENAKKSHKTRFLDRQRLTRLARKATEQNRLAIAVDMAFCAHFPHQYKYMPLFKNGQNRIQDARKLLKKRAAIRHEILSSSHPLERVNWIDATLYDMLPKSWSVEQEEAIFGVRGPSNKSKDAITDDRFASTMHDALLQAAQEAEQQAVEDINEQEKQRKHAVEDDGGSISRDSSSDGEMSVHDDDGGDSSSSSDGDADLTVGQEMVKKNVEGGWSSDSDSSSSNTSRRDGSSDEGDASAGKESTGVMGDKKIQEEESMVEEEEAEIDNFLVAASDDIDERAAFQQAKRHLPSIDEFMGDKSQGWNTQRQRPGAFKRKKCRY